MQLLPAFGDLWSLAHLKNIRVGSPLTKLSGSAHGYSLRARNRFNQVVEAKRFEGVFLCRNVCKIQKSNCAVCNTLSFSETIIIVDDKTVVLHKIEFKSALV